MGRDAANSLRASVELVYTSAIRQRRISRRLLSAHLVSASPGSSLVPESFRWLPSLSPSNFRFKIFTSHDTPQLSKHTFQLADNAATASMLTKVVLVLMQRYCSMRVALLQLLLRRSAAIASSLQKSSVPLTMVDYDNDD
uniref:Uncharacterized protein n=1 Tax=Romanomermis culicivorax TaxID=13658 RepID=A0A915IJT4_ROMCU